MAGSISRILIEKIGRNMLKSIRDNSRGATRSLIEKALNFSNEHFKTGFFGRVQQVLCDESSTYYQLLHAVAADVDHDRLMRAGMNMAFNGVISGSRKIRQIEAAEGFRVPWALHLQTDGVFLERNMDAYRSLIAQGRGMGIFTWFIHSKTLSDGLCRLLTEYDDCAFVLLLDSDQMSHEDIERAERMKHIVISMSAGEKAKEICGRLREKKMLYALHVRYEQENLKAAMSEKLLCDAQNMNVPMVFFVPQRTCTDAQKTAVREYVDQQRRKPKFRTLLCDMVQDVLDVNRVISGEGCSAGFCADGSFASIPEAHQAGRWNLIETPLKEILAGALKK